MKVCYLEQLQNLAWYLKIANLSKYISEIVFFTLFLIKNLTQQARNYFPYVSLKAYYIVVDF